MQQDTREAQAMALKQKVVVLVAEDDEGHFVLIRNNIQRAGFSNGIVRFSDGQAILDFLFMRGDGPVCTPGKSYILLLDLSIPKVDGIEVLRQIKADGELKKMPVIMLTAAGDHAEIEQCYGYGCNACIIKPAEYDNFVDAIHKVGLFLSIVSLPRINGQT